MSLNPLFYKGRTRLKRRGRERDNLVFVGRTQVEKYQVHKSIHPSIIACYDELPELANYKLPSQTPADEIYALRCMTDAMREETEISKHYLLLANEIVKEVTPKSPRPAWFDRGLLLSDILEVINRFDRSKHPGYPASLFCQTKGDVIDYYLPDLVQAVLCRLVCLEYLAPYCQSAEDLYRCFCIDLSSLSIKTEFIKKDKNGRIICANGVVTATIEGLCYFPYNEKFKAAVFENYSAVGIGFTTADCLLFRATLPKEVASNDSPRFDSTTTSFECALDLAVKRHSYALDKFRHKRAIAIMTYLEIGFCNKLFLISDGKIYVQTKEGFTPSGRDQTTNDNTQKRARRAYAVDLKIEVECGPIIPRPTVAGDDATETHHPKKVEMYASLGFPIKDYSNDPDVEFCSHKWPEGKQPYGLRIWKSTCTLLQASKIEEEALLAFCREYHSNEYFPAVIEVISTHRPEINILLESIEIFEEEKLKKVNLDLSEERMFVNNVGDFDTTVDFSECAKSGEQFVQYKKCSGKNKKKAMSSKMPQVRKIKGRGDYTSEVKAIIDPVKRLERKIDHINSIVDKGSEGVGSLIGRGLGTLVGQGDLGASAGNAIQRWFGHGDYDLKTNSLIKLGDNHTAAISPTFSADGKRGLRVREREYLGDVISSATPGQFSVAKYRVNPADTKTFPWLSSTAVSFETNEPKGVIFEFHSTSGSFNGTSQALGTVAMMTDYDVKDLPPTSLVEMNNADYACAASTNNNLMHGLECDPNERAFRSYYNSSDTPSDVDIRNTDFANFYIATVGVSAASVNVGQLWVTYDYVLYKKQLSLGPAATKDILIKWTDGTNAIPSTPFGTTTTRTATGNLNLNFNSSGSKFMLPGIASGRYFVEFSIFATSLTNTGAATITYTNCEQRDGTSYQSQSSYGSGVNRVITSFTFDVTGLNPTVQLNMSGLTLNAVTTYIAYLKVLALNSTDTIDSSIIVNYSVF